MAFAGQMFGLEVRVYMVNVSYQQKPFRRSMMQTWGAEVFASPSKMTQTGRDLLEQDPENQGSLGIAISEAVEEAASRADTSYALGSVLNHVALHQTIIGQEAKKQFAKAATGRMSSLHPVAAVRRLPGWLFRSSPTTLPAAARADRRDWLPSSRPPVRR
jgi:predicted alternative tryptophan synthase beta-subunit